MSPMKVPDCPDSGLLRRKKEPRQRKWIKRWIIVFIPAQSGAAFQNQSDWVSVSWGCMSPRREIQSEMPSFCRKRCFSCSENHRSSAEWRVNFRKLCKSKGRKFSPFWMLAGSVGGLSRKEVSREKWLVDDVAFGGIDGDHVWLLWKLQNTGSLL